MAVDGTFYTGRRGRLGSSPASSNIIEGETQAPVNPEGFPVGHVPVTIGGYPNGLTIDPSTQVLNLEIGDGLGVDGYGRLEATGGGGGLTGSGTANEIAYFIGATALASLAAATYPNLTELSYVKDVTSPIQSQLNGKNAALGTNINAALTGADTPSAANVFATMADVSGGVRDNDAVHYDAADGKTATEKQQARDNIGLFNGLITTITVRSNLFRHDIARPSNYLVFEQNGAETLSGMVAGKPNEIVVIRNENNFGFTILTENGGSLPQNRFSLSGNLIMNDGTFAFFMYNEVLQRWVTPFFMVNQANVIKRNFEFISDINTDIFRLLYLTNTASIERFGVYFNNYTQMLLSVKGAGIECGVLLNPQAGFFASGTAQSRFEHNGAGSGNGSVNVKCLNNSSGGRMFTIQDNLNAYVVIVQSNGTITHPRSNASDRSIRRDEQRLYYLVSVTTAGAINDQALTDGIFNYRFTAATSITGFTLGEIGRTIDIDNATGSTLTLNHENAGSIAANRIKLIGAANLVIPIDGKVTLKYCTGSRWELVSKNF